MFSLLKFVAIVRELQPFPAFSGQEAGGMTERRTDQSVLPRLPGNVSAVVTPTAGHFTAESLRYAPLARSGIPAAWPAPAPCRLCRARRAGTPPGKAPRRSPGQTRSTATASRH